MSEPLRLRVLTPAGPVDEGEVRSVVLPGAAGTIGVRRGHAPLLLALRPGPMVIVAPDGTERQLAINGGLADVSGGMVIVAAPEATPAEAISAEEAIEEVEQAAERFERSTGKTEHAHALAEFDRALARLRVTGENKLWERAMRKRRKFARFEFARDDENRSKS